MLAILSDNSKSYYSSETESVQVSAGPLLKGSLFTKLQYHELGF